MAPIVYEIQILKIPHLLRKSTLCLFSFHCFAIDSTQMPRWNTHLVNPHMDGHTFKIKLVSSVRLYISLSISIRCYKPPYCVCIISDEVLQWSWDKNHKRCSLCTCFICKNNCFPSVAIASLIIIYCHYLLWVVFYKFLLVCRFHFCDNTIILN